MTLRQLYLSPRGRLNRQPFWLYSLPLTIPFLIGQLVSRETTPIWFVAIVPVAVLFVLVGSLMLNIKRLHDLNRSGWSLVLLLVPIAGPIAAFIYLGFTPGTAGENHYGPDPLADAGPLDAPPREDVDDKFFRTGWWVDLEDVWDQDRYRLGPFPTRESAHEFCDAHNGEQLERDGGIPEKINFATDVGVWDQATTSGYSLEIRMLHLLRHPEQTPQDADAIKKRWGVKSEAEWRRAKYAKIEVDTCWCELLSGGTLPEGVPNRMLTAYWNNKLGYTDLTRINKLFGTTQHHGDVSEMTCGVCGGAVLHLLIEHGGLGNPISHYFTPATKADLALFSSGSIDGATYESWVGQRCGIYRYGNYITFFKGANVGDPPRDHLYATPAT